MKRIKKVLILFVMILFVGMSDVSFLAATSSQDGLEVTFTTDKEEYRTDEQVSTTLTVKNTNNFAILNIELETIIPDGYELMKEAEATKQIASLDAGETITFTVVCISSEEGKENIKSPNTSYSDIGISFITVSCVAVMFWAVKTKKGKKFLAFVLCISVVGTSIGIPSIQAEATSITRKNIEMEKVVLVDGKQITIKATISYNSIDKENQIDTQKTYTVKFDSNGGSKIEAKKVKKGELVTCPSEPVKESYTFLGWCTDKDCTIFFDFASQTITEDITLYAYWINLEQDADNDEIADDLEELIGINSELADSDGDGLTDYYEIVYTSTNPLEKDTDGDNIPDGQEDYDGDKLINQEEVIYGANASLKDTDGDNLLDYDEVYLYKTNPVNADTDGDFVSDGKEIEIGSNPLEVETVFDVEVSAENAEDVSASVNVALSGEQVETLKVEKNMNETLFPNTIPGYIGSAYDFSVDGTFEKASISFSFDESLMQEEGFNPVIYYYNEAEQDLEELETVVSNGTATAKVEHFSTYILINKTVYEKAFSWIDVWDANNNYTGIELVLVIDDSGSMWDNDKQNERLIVAQELIEDLPINSKTGIVKFAYRTSILTPFLTDDKELAKGYLTTEFFKSDGGTYMYSAIDSSLPLYESEQSDIMKVMVVLSDGVSSDSYKHSSTVAKANGENIKIYTVGLGTDNYYFDRYLQPLSINTGGKFYFASDAGELSGIYDDISEKIDMETDSDADGISDYYEDNMVIFNGVKIKLDKNNADTDGDGLLDGEEIELKYTYNEDSTKVIVEGKMKSNPVSLDTDGDGLYDNAERVKDGKIIAPKDPDPLKYNGETGMWEAHIDAAYTEIIPTEYAQQSGFELLEALPQPIADFVVKMIIKLDDPLEDHQTICKVIALAIRGGYLVLDYVSEKLDEKFDIGELDEEIGAYILNFIRDNEDIAYHSQPDTWQRNFGYNKFYDDIFDVGTKMQTSNDLCFEADGLTYALWMWKGDYYNLHSGAEIGLYQFTGKDAATGIDLYKAIDFELPMTLNLYYYGSENNIDHIFGWAPTEKQWWITGFNTDEEYEKPWGLPMVSVGTIDFSEYESMFEGLKESMKDNNSDYSKYFIFDDDKHTLWIMWDKH